MVASTQISLLMSVSVCFYWRLRVFVIFYMNYNGLDYDIFTVNKLLSAYVYSYNLKLGFQN